MTKNCAISKSIKSKDFYINVLVYFLVLLPLISVIFPDVYGYLIQHFDLPKLKLTDDFIESKGQFLKQLWILFSLSLLFLMKFKDRLKRTSIKEFFAFYMDCFLVLILQVIFMSAIAAIWNNIFPGLDLKLFNNENFFTILILFLFFKLGSPMILLFASTAYDGYNSFGNFFLLSYLYLTEFFYFFVPNISNIRTPGKYFFGVEVNERKSTFVKTILKSYLDVFFMYLALGFAITLTAFFSLGLKEKLNTDS